MDYPDWVCLECGTRLGRKVPGIACWHNGVCGVCQENKEVTEPRDFGHLPSHPAFYTLRRQQ